MLTLKVITTDLDGQTESHILSGDTITHKEQFSSDHCLASKWKEENSFVWILGSMTETSSEQKFIYSVVHIYDEERNNKNVLLVLPKSDCYIMENGKTVDMFNCVFEK